MGAEFTVGTLEEMCDLMCDNAVPEKLCETCIYRNQDEYHKPCIVRRDDCEYYEKERGDMTREEAILCLKGIKNYGRDTFTEQSDWQNSLDMAIEALEQEPKTDVLDKIRDEIRKHCEYYMDGDIIADEVIQAVENICKAESEEDMNEVGVEIVKTEETEKSGIKYLNINVSNSEVERKPDIVRLCADAGILEYVKTSGDAISRQAVLDAVDKWVKNMGVLIAFPTSEVTPLFESIHELPSVNPQEPCEDAISRKRVMAEYCMREGVSKKSFVDIINELPSVNPQEPKTGHWIFDDECKEHGHCSQCGYGSVDLVDGESHNYCRNCGAWMVEPQESEDKCKNCEYYHNPDYTRCHKCKAESEDKE